MTIIEQLQNNRVAFILMDPELQEAAKLIPLPEFEVLHDTDPESWGRCDGSTGWSVAGAVHTRTFRLRPDYQEPEPEIEEYGIDFNRNSNYQYYIRENEHCISDACDDPDFIGFECDGWIFGMAYKNKTTGNMAMMIPADQLHKYEVCDLTQGHVLFRRAK